jgi:uncharacterized protein (DUF488 family)
MIKELYSLGTSNRSLPEFITILKGFNIQRVVDVRRFPTSKKFVHFKRDNLAQALEREGIEYIYMGTSLGGYRKGGYQEYMQTEDFRSALNSLKRLVEEKRSCIFCCERLYFRCHRRFITQALSGEFKIIHIIEPDRVRKG